MCGAQSQYHMNSADTAIRGQAGAVGLLVSGCEGGESGENGVNA